MSGSARPVTPVGIAAAELAAVADLLVGVPGVPAEASARLAHAHALAAGLDEYLCRSSTPESPALAALAARTRAIDWDAPPFAGSAGGLEQEMLSGHLEGQVLAFLVKLTGARTVLDIGTFTGYSALAMAEALPDDGEVVACERDPHVAALAAAWTAESPAGRRVRVRVGDAADTLAALAAEGRRFDMVFLDADKAGYLGALRTLLDTALLAPGALVAVDNTLLQGEPYGPPEARGVPGAAIAEFNAAVVADPRVEQVVLPVRDGLTLLRRVDRA